MQPCNSDIFRNGKLILLIDGRKDDVEAWVKAVGQASGVKLDWYYGGGVAHVMFLGVYVEGLQVMRAADTLISKLNGRVTRRIAPTR